MQSSLLARTVSACAIALAATTVYGSSQAPSDFAAGSFKSPAMTVKPKFRYWLPDASIDPASFTDDIAQLGKRGAGGTELLNYFEFPTGVAPNDWDVYGYGTPAYASILRVAIEAHRDNGMVFDYASSCSGAVPAEKGNPGLAWEVTYYSETLNGTFKGTLPGWGKGDFISAVTFAVVDIGTHPAESHGPFGAGSPYPVYTISNASLTEVTQLVGSDGSIEIAPTKADEALYYVLQAYYAYQPLYRHQLAYTNTPQNILQNGSVLVDHYSTTGAKVITDFLEEYVLVNGNRELLQKYGNYIWEDSVEIAGHSYWTPSVAENFQERFNYSILPYVTLLVNRNGYQTQSPPLMYILDTEDQGYGILSDFRELLSVLAGTYTSWMEQWTHDFLGLEFSAQMGYNMPEDMLQTIPYVDVPETETLSFQNYIDGFLQCAGAADLSGKKILSIELGADYHLAYWQTWEYLLYDAKHAFAGGVNKVVIHGATYSHNFTNTTWPGYTSFGYDFPGQHSRHQPAWDVGYSEALGFLGRVSWVLQSGVPKVDLILWDKQTAQNAFPAPLYVPGDLTDAGYTYEYLSPANFVLEKAVVGPGLFTDISFAPEKQAASAIIVRGNDTMTPDGAQYLAKYAAAGLPIVFSGGIPSLYASANHAAISTANETLHGLLKHRNVHQVPYEELAASIESIGILPRVQTRTNGTWYTRWREISNRDVYVFIYNDGNDSVGQVTFAATGTPYLLNAWTGAAELIVEYTTHLGFTTISLPLKKHESRIVKFSAGQQLIAHVTSSSDSVLGFDVQDSGRKIQAKVAASSSSSSVTLSTGKTVTLSTRGVQLAYSLSNWSVVIEHWLSPDDFYDLGPDAKKVNLTVPIQGPVLASWDALGYQNVSGVGYYSTSFDWEPSGANGSSWGAYITVPPVSDGLVAMLNGQVLPPMDIVNPSMDISTFLVRGKNLLELKVSTTLKNSLFPYYSELRTAGGGPITSWSSDAALGYGLEQYGIIGEVRIVPYAMVPISK